MVANKNNILNFTFFYFSIYFYFILFIFLIFFSLFFVGVKGKVDLCIASYACVSKSWSFVKLHKIGNFPT